MTRSLLDRAADLRTAAEQVRARKAAGAHVDALGDAQREFSEIRDELRPALEEARVLSAHSVRIAVPTNGPQIASGIRELADRVFADPATVRQRREQVDRARGFLHGVRGDVDAALRGRVEQARGTMEAGMVGALRQIGLNDAARSLEQALATLNRFTANPPRTADDLQAVDDAGDTIRSTLAALEEPRYARLVAFFQRASRSPAPTLGDVDADLLAELQASGAAKNFAIVPVEQ